MALQDSGTNATHTRTQHRGFRRGMKFILTMHQMQGVSQYVGTHTLLGPFMDPRCDMGAR